MTRTYDELELLPKVVPSARHANRTLCCDITAADHEVGKKLSRTMKEVYGDATLPNDKIVILFRGAAGDRFGTGLGSGITFVADKIGANGCADMNGGRALILSLPREGFCHGLKNGNVFVYSRGMDIPLASGAYTVGKPNASERAEIRRLLKSTNCSRTQRSQAPSYLTGMNPTVDSSVSQRPFNLPHRITKSTGIKMK